MNRENKNMKTRIGKLNSVTVDIFYYIKKNIKIY